MQKRLRQHEDPLHIDEGFDHSDTALLCDSANLSQERIEQLCGGKQYDDCDASWKLLARQIMGLVRYRRCYYAGRSITIPKKDLVRGGVSIPQIAKELEVQDDYVWAVVLQARSEPVANGDPRGEKRFFVYMGSDAEPPCALPVVEERRWVKKARTEKAKQYQ